MQPARVIRTTIRRIDPQTGQLIDEQVLPGNHESRYKSNYTGGSNLGISFGCDQSLYNEAYASGYNKGYASGYTKGEPSTDLKSQNFSNMKDSLNNLQGKSTVSKNEDTIKDIESNEQQNLDDDNVRTNNPNSTDNFKLGESKIQDQVNESE